MGKYLFAYMFLIPICKLKLKGCSHVASSFQYTWHTYVKRSDLICLTASVRLKQQNLQTWSGLQTQFAGLLIMSNFQ